MTDKVALGKFLRAAREKNTTFSIKDLADHLGYKNRMTIYHVEKGDAWPPRKRLTHWCNLIKVDPIKTADYLLELKKARDKDRIKRKTTIYAEDTSKTNSEPREMLNLRVGADYKLSLRMLADKHFNGNLSATARAAFDLLFEKLEHK